MRRPKAESRVRTAVGAGSSEIMEIPEANQEQTPFPGPELSLGSACSSEDARPAQWAPPSPAQIIPLLGFTRAFQAA